MIFPFSSKADLLFGVGASEQLGAKVKELGCTKVICIYDKGIQEAGLINPLIENMKAAGLDVIEYDGVQADPPDTMVNECAAIARNANYAVDLLISGNGRALIDHGVRWICLNSVVLNDIKTGCFHVVNQGIYQSSFLDSLIIDADNLSTSKFFHLSAKLLRSAYAK